MSAQAHADHGAPTSFVRRWLYSTNHKDIGTMYLVFAILAAFIGGGLSIYMRMELMEPGVQYMADGHVWNVFTTAHGLIMVFFVVMPGLIGGFGNWFVPIMIGTNQLPKPPIRPGITTKKTMIRPWAVVKTFQTWPSAIY